MEPRCQEKFKGFFSRRRWPAGNVKTELAETVGNSWDMAPIPENPHVPYKAVSPKFFYTISVLSQFRGDPFWRISPSRCRQMSPCRTQKREPVSSRIFHRYPSKTRIWLSRHFRCSALSQTSFSTLAPIRHPALPRISTFRVAENCNEPHTPPDRIPPGPLRFARSFPVFRKCPKPSFSD